MDYIIITNARAATARANHATLLEVAPLPLLGVGLLGVEEPAAKMLPKNVAWQPVAGLPDKGRLV